MLRRPKFKFSAEAVESFLSAFSRLGVCVEPTASGVVLPDVKDIPFYEVALESGVNDTYLVTGNIKHFPKEPFVVTPAEFVRILEED